MNEPLVSIIIPIYNVEAYLRECLNSVINQTYPHWECIMINDASTDGSAEIAREFCACDNRFHLLNHLENRGLSEARNTGLDNAKGELITFIDSDDYVSKDFLSLGVKSIPGNDIVCFGFSGSKNCDTIYSGPEAVSRFLYQTGEINSSFCGKIFTRKSLDNKRFRAGITYEDLDLADQVFIDANSVKINNNDVYFYRQRPGSILHTWNRKRLDILEVTEKIEKRLEEYPDLLRAAQARRFAANFNILLLLRKNGMKHSLEAKECRRQLKRLRRQVLFDPKARLKDRIGAAVAFIYI